ncbi:MAG TPA: hypothetical protein PK322_12725 [Opitutaceae bacterium]|nr:hypothetical protein [Opitutaceae bacterium]
MKTYRHDTRLFFAVPLMIGLLLYVSYATWVFDGALRGGEVMRYGLVGFAALLSVLLTFLFLNFGVVRYYVLPEGLMVKTLWSSAVRGWEELRPPTVNRTLKCFTVRDTTGKVVIFSSTDFFRHVNEFVDELQTRARAQPHR